VGDYSLVWKGEERYKKDFFRLFNVVDRAGLPGIYRSGHYVDMAVWVYRRISALDFTAGELIVSLNMLEGKHIPRVLVDSYKRVRRDVNKELAKDRDRKVIDLPEEVKFGLVVLTMLGEARNRIWGDMEFEERGNISPIGYILKYFRVFSELAFPSLHYAMNRLFEIEQGEISDVSDEINLRISRMIIERVCAEVYDEGE
jgi:hypothetical protein